MTEITDDDIAAEARAMVRQMIEESGWYPKLRGEFRQARIDQDVDRMWHLMIADARKRLEQAFGRAEAVEGRAVLDSDRK